MKLKTLFFGLVMLLAIPSLQAQGGEKHFDLAEEGGASVLSIGKIVLANWSYDDFWYAGKVEKISHDKYFVRFYDNEGEWLTTENLTTFFLGEGDQVFCKASGGLIYKLAEIGKIEGEKIFLKYVEDGSTEWNEIGNIRLKAK